jgi:DNA-binding response OmpR family regulator
VVSLKTSILLIEGKRGERPSLKANLTNKGFEVESVSSGSIALQHLKVEQPNLVIVDAASMRTSGKRIVQSIQQFSHDLPVILILDKDAEIPEKSEADAVLVEPFTLQKLINRIRPLIPTDKKDLIIAGPIQLNPKQRWVRCYERQSRLTPRLVTLLKTLMTRPGEVIDRKELFRQVWDTSYVEDMRTLDVHISWLRHAIEENPQRPRFIKTIRGAGYRLDLDFEKKLR